MKYKVTIEQLSESTHEYRQHDTMTIYEQLVEDLDVKAVVDVVNRVNETEGKYVRFLEPMPDSDE